MYYNFTGTGGDPRSNTALALPITVVIAVALAVALVFTVVALFLRSINKRSNAHHHQFSLINVCSFFKTI